MDYINLAQDKDQWQACELCNEPLSSKEKKKKKKAVIVLISSVTINISRNIRI
jgi:hypothetical protein